MKKRVRTLKLYRETVIALDREAARGGVGETEAVPLCTIKCASGPYHHCFGTMEDSCFAC